MKFIRVGDENSTRVDKIFVDGVIFTEPVILIDFENEFLVAYDDFKDKIKNRYRDHFKIIHGKITVEWVY